MKITDDELRQLSTSVDQTLRKIEGKQVGFCLLAFNFGDDPNNRMIYSSNAERNTMIEAMEEFLANHKATPEGAIPPVQVS